MEKRIPMTPAGKRVMEEKLKNLRKVERPRIIAAIEEARSHGDLAENAEYDAAKDRQHQIDQRIRELEHKLSLVDVIDPKTINSERIVFGATVVLSDVDSGGEVTYIIVGSDEADLSHGKISIESPIARALIGKEGGDEVCVKTPKGPKKFEIVEVRYG